jgi:hypothetical protein
MWATITQLVGGLMIGALPALCLGFVMGRNERAQSGRSSSWVKLSALLLDERGLAVVKNLCAALNISFALFPDQTLDMLAKSRIELRQWFAEGFREVSLSIIQLGKLPKIVEHRRHAFLLHQVIDGNHSLTV